MVAKLTTGQFTDKAKNVHGDRYDYVYVEYISSHIPVQIRCIKHDFIFYQSPANHLSGKGCSICANESRSKTQSMSYDDFLRQAILVHGYYFDYSRAKYSTARIKVEIICPEHGSFFQTPDHHLRGDICPKCARAAQFLTTEDFIAKSRIMHGDRYDYSESHYEHNKIPIKIICRQHGYFWQRPHCHWIGEGCPECARETWRDQVSYSTDEFIAQAISVHGDKYDYSETTYVRCIDKVKIICPTHGPFYQIAQSHTNQKSGCPKCTSVVSKPETEWLDSLNIPAEYRQITVKVGSTWIKADAFDPITNTVFEFYGDYWHGNPTVFDPSDLNTKNKTSFGELYKQTMEREQLLTRSGFKVVSIWEYDWKYSRR